MSHLYEKIQKLTEKLKNEIAAEPSHKFFFGQRLNLYEIFGSLSYGQYNNQEKTHFEQLEKDILNLPIANKFYAWLAILSTKKVLEQFKSGVLPREKWRTSATPYSEGLNNIPEKIINLAEQVLLSEAKPSLAWFHLNNEYYYAADTIHNVYDYSSVCIFEAATAALSAALGIVDFQGDMQDYARLRTEIVQGEASSQALAAFATLAETLDHLWDEWQPRKYSVAKRLEFWLWWLDVAVPQALQRI